MSSSDEDAASKKARKKARKPSEREGEQGQGLLADSSSMAPDSPRFGPRADSQSHSRASSYDVPPPLSSPQSEAPFAALSGGDTPPSGSGRSPQRRHEQVDRRHPLPASSPPPFISMPSPSPSPNAIRNLALGNEAYSTREIWRQRGYGLLSVTTWIYYLRHAWRESTKRKCNYALGLFSVFLVVMVAAVCNTLIARAPVVFLQQAETSAGQIDLQLTPSSGLAANFINFTTLTENVGSATSYSYSTSRTEFSVHLLPAASCPYGNPLEVDWKYVGFDNDTSIACTNKTLACIEQLCSFSATALSEFPSLWAIDTAREKRMGLGRMWPYGALAEGEMLITRDVARQWNLKVGDIAQVKFGALGLAGALHGLINTAMARSVQWDGAKNPANHVDGNASLVLDAFVTHFGSHAYVPFTIAGVLPKTYGKFDSDAEMFLVIEQDVLLPHILKNLHPAMRETLRISDMVGLLGWPASLVKAASLSSMSQLPRSLARYPSLYPSLMTMDSYASIILFNLGKERIPTYLSTNFDAIQSTVIAWSSKVIYFAGFTQLDASLPILAKLDDVKLFSVYLGLILSIILTILFLLSTLLIYSLLMISIESRTFELGVHRMCGMPRFDIIKLLTVQALSFAIPAWALGLIVSQIAVAVVIGSLEKSVEVPLDRLLTQQSIGIASIMGLLLPLLASILPIRSALGKNLQDALDTRHSKTAGVEFSIERSVDAGVDGAWMALGVGMAVLGGCIYYLVPLALLSFNLALFFNIFFALLLGMLLGLILLSLNLQPLLERAIVFVFLSWWEKRALTFIVVKNLITHRVRNRKTSIMFAVSLAFILFITMAFQLELYTAKARQYKTYGSDMVVYPRYSGSSGTLAPYYVARLEAVLAAHPDAVSSWGWVTARLNWNSEWSDTWISNVGHAYTVGVEVWGVSSNLFETTFNEYLVRDENSPNVSETPLSEQLYTAHGSQASILGTSAKSQFGLHNTDGSKTSFLYALQKRQTEGVPASFQFHRMRPLTFLDSSPRFAVGRFPSLRAQPTLVSLPTFLRLSNNAYSRIQDIPMSSCILQLKSGASKAQIDSLATALTEFTKPIGFRVWDLRDAAAALASSNDAMSLVFTSATYVAMFLCLFSLVASMLTNIYEQAKEISVLRSLGLPKTAIVRVFTEEAFVLVLSSSMLGIAIGIIMAGTMVAQRVLFTQLPVPFMFPYGVLAYSFTGSVVCAAVSSVFPSRNLMKRSIASLGKSVL